MNIRHLVLSGGGPSLFKTIGALQVLEKANKIQLKNIESIYGTSAGAICAVTLSLGFDWDTINKYFVDRPWNEAYPITPTSIFDAYGKKGIFGREFVSKAFIPLFNAKDFDINITMKEFHEKTNIDLYFYTMELNQFENVEISHYTHPDLEVVDAVYMSCSLPIIIAPVCQDGKCYLDGGLGANYPVKQCVDRVNDIDEILGICVSNSSSTDDEEKDQKIINTDSSILEYMSTIFVKMVKHINLSIERPQLKHEITFKGRKLTFEYIQQAINSKEIRQELLNDGISCGELFIKTQDKNENVSLDTNDNKIPSRSSFDEDMPIY